MHRGGGIVKYHDPYVENLNFNDIDLKSIIKLDKDSLEKFDACVILTNHSNISYKIIAENSNLIIDTRNVFHDINRDHIIRLGQGIK